MKARRGYYSALLMAAAYASLSSSASAVDAKRGKTIAKRWCSACHVVTSDQKSASADAPSFADIAKRRTDAKALANFLADPHPKMPDMSLSRDEINDIVAYIRNLDPRAAPPREPGDEKLDRPKNG